MKYNLGVQTVEAVYDNSGTQNPLIEALPECLGSEQFTQQIRCCPPPPQACQDMSMAERRQGLALLPTVFVPLPYMYYVYDSLYRMLTSSYTRSLQGSALRKSMPCFSPAAPWPDTERRHSPGRCWGRPGWARPVRSGAA